MPFTSLEVRWFFPEALDRYPELQQWMEMARPFPRDDDAPPMAAEPASPQTDTYLMMPGAHDIGFYWRAGQPRIKGRISRLGLQRYAGRFYGMAEVWAAWSPCEGPAAGSATRPSLTGETMAVRRTSRIRRTRLSIHGRHVESTGTNPERALIVELSDLDVDGRRFCSLALKAYPHDPATTDVFSEAAGAWLAELHDPRVVLAEHQSMGYPEFLQSLSRLKN